MISSWNSCANLVASWTGGGFGKLETLRLRLNGKPGCSLGTIRDSKVSLPFSLFRRRSKSSKFYPCHNRSYVKDLFIGRVLKFEMVAYRFEIFLQICQKLAS